MNTKLIEDFAQRYSARLSYQQAPRSSFHTYGKSLDYYDDPRHVVDMELPMRAFEYLVEADYRAEQDYQAQREERFLRAKYPAVRDAYDQYQMVLALCK